MQVRDLLVAACQQRGVRIRYGASLESFQRITDPTDPSPAGTQDRQGAGASQHSSQQPVSQSPGSQPTQGQRKTQAGCAACTMGQ